MRPREERGQRNPHIGLVRCRKREFCPIAHHRSTEAGRLASWRNVQGEMVIARSPRLIAAPLRDATTGQVACCLGRTNRMFAKSAVTEQLRRNFHFPAPRTPGICLRGSSVVSESGRSGNPPRRIGGRRGAAFTPRSASSLSLGRTGEPGLGISLLLAVHPRPSGRGDGNSSATGSPARMRRWFSTPVVRAVATPARNPLLGGMARMIGIVCRTSSRSRPHGREAAQVPQKVRNTRSSGAGGSANAASPPPSS